MTSDVERAVWRLEHIEQAIAHIRELLSGKSIDCLTSDFVVRAAYERLLEIISEAVRHTPTAWRDNHPDVPWQQIAGAGNILRHAYDKVEPAILWKIYTDDLHALAAAVEAMFSAHDPDRRF